jgi:hypothetical protein
MAVEKVGGGGTHCPTSHVARLAGRHLASYHLRHVGGAPPSHGPIKTPLPVKVDTQTPHFGDSTCKALFLSVVDMHSLVGTVVRF